MLPMSATSDDPGPMARLAVVKADPDAPNAIFQRIAEGEELPQIAKAWGLPKGGFAYWFSTVHGDLYDAARKVREADLAMQMLDEAKGASSENVQVAKLRIDTLKWLMSKWDRARYGETVKIEKAVTVGVDAGLVLTMGELFVRLGKPQPRIIEHAVESMDAGLI